MYKKDMLKNGLSVVTSDMPHMESVSIGIWIGVGGRHESKKYCGISHVIEHMLFKGTQERSAVDLKEAIEGIGGSFNAFTAEEMTCYLVKLPAAHTKLGLDILSDMVLHPAFNPLELEKEKLVVCEEIKMYMDHPAQYVFEILAEEMWPDHPLGRPIAGYINSVKALKRDDLLAFKNDFYEPPNMAVVACGKIDRRNIFKFIKETFAGTSKRTGFRFAPVRKKDKAKSLTLFTKKTEQTHVAFGFHSLSAEHKMRYPLSLLNIILGGNMSSRLFERLREHKALCYDISSSAKKYKETGAFVIHAGIANAKLHEATREIMRELTDIKRNNVSRKELAMAKEYAKGQFLLGTESTSSRMIWLGERIMTTGNAPSVREIVSNIEKVTIEDIRKTAAMIFREENLNFASIGPAGKKEKAGLKGLLKI